MSSHSKAAARSSWALVAALVTALVWGFATHQVAYADEETLISGSTIVKTVPQGDGDAANIKGYTNVCPVFRYGWQEDKVFFNSSATVKTLDITGDGDADTIKVTSSKSSSSSPYLNKVKIAINGKTKKTIKASGIDRVAIAERNT